MKHPTILRSLTVMLTILIASVASAYDINYNDIYYNINSDGVSVSVTYGFNKYTGDIEIPNQVTKSDMDYPVTGIANNAFANCTDLTSITIPQSVTSISNKAFSYCENLTRIRVKNNPIYNDGFLDNVIIETATNTLIVGCKNSYIPSTVTTIGDNAFLGVPLTSITIPSSVVKICSGAFSNTDLTSISIPNSVVEIGSEAFYKTNLSSLSIPSSVVKISSSAFHGTPFWSNQPNGLVYLGQILYGYHGNLSQIPEHITIEEGTTCVSSGIFKGCSNLVSVTFPESITEIPDEMFYKCTNLTSVNIPNTIKAIGQYAFYDCSSLTEMEIPNSVTDIGQSAFSGCRGLTKINIPNSLTYINRSVFNSCSSITSIDIPNSVTDIGPFAFYGCSNLTSIDIPTSVTNIDWCAFSDCSDLTSIDIPTSVTNIDRDAFSGCSNLTSVNIPNSVISIGLNCFTDTPFFNNQPDGLVYLGSVLYKYKGTMPENTSITIEDGTISISPEAFKNCGNLTSVNIPSSITTIGKSAFVSCDGLTSVVIPQSVTTIGEKAFGYCDYLVKSAYPESLTNPFPSGITIAYPSDAIIDENGAIFNGDKTLLYFVPCDATEVRIPSSVTSIDANAFLGCTDLTTLYYDAINCTVTQDWLKDSTAISSFTISNGVKIIPEYLCYNLTKLNTMTIPNTVTEIGANAFNGCSSLKSVVIGAGVSLFGDFAFSIYKVNKEFWLPNTIPSGKSNINATINYVSDAKTYYCVNSPGWLEYKFLSSMFTVDGLVYIPISPSDRTCDLVDCTYSSDYTDIIVSDKVNYRGIDLKLINVNPYSLILNHYIKTVDISNPGKVGESAFQQCTRLLSATLTNHGVIDEAAFYNCPALRYAKVSNHSSVNDLAFSRCFNLQELIIDNLGDIGYQAFAECGNIENLIVENKGVIGIDAFRLGKIQNLIVANDGLVGSSAFQDCTDLKTVTITSQGYIGYYAFKNCTSLQTANISNKGSIGSYAFSGCTSLQTANISNNSSIGSYAFNGCSVLTSAIIEEEVSAIGSKAFYNCTLLDEMLIPNSVSSLGTSAFEGCSSLDNLTIGTSITSLPERVLYGCTSLRTLSIPNNITSIDVDAFGSCTALENVTFEDGSTKLTLNGESPMFKECPLDEVYIGRELAFPSNNSPFRENTSLRTVQIADAETKVYSYEFYNCSNLYTMIIGIGVKTIGSYAFSGCSSLNFISLGYNVESIGQEAFSDCINLATIWCFASVPPTCGTQALDDINKWNCTLYVLDTCIDDYMVADQWKEFFLVSKEEDPIDYNYALTIDGNTLHCHGQYTEVYTLSGIKVYGGCDDAKLPAGTYIVIVEKQPATKIKVN